MSIKISSLVVKLLNRWVSIEGCKLKGMADCQDAKIFPSQLVQRSENERCFGYNSKYKEKTYFERENSAMLSIICWYIPSGHNSARVASRTEIKATEIPRYIQYRVVNMVLRSLSETKPCWRRNRFLNDSYRETIGMS